MKPQRISAIIERDMRKFLRSPALMMSSMIFPLMQLIVLTVGLNMGVITPTLFAMMVVMAIVTTMATAPLLRAILPGNGDVDPAVGRGAGTAPAARR